MGKLKESLLSDPEEYNLTGLAIVKAHAFAQEYNPTNGKVEDRLGYHYLKEGYTEGFLAGFIYKITGETEL
jgi:hypothetical protein